MKKKVVALFAAASMMLGACSGGGNSNLSGSLDGVACDTMLVFVYNMANGKFMYTDTVPLQQKKFAIQLPDTGLISAYLSPKPQVVNGKMQGMIMPKYPVILLPGDQLVLSGDIKKPIVSGSVFYDQMQQLTDLDGLEKQVDELDEEFRDLYKDREKNASALDSIRGLFKSVSKKMVDVKFEYIKAHPDQLVSGFLVTQLSAQKGLDAMKILSADVKNGPFKPLIDRAKKNCENTLQREIARERIQPGKPAPDFKLNNLEGKEMTLASFHGKYVLLDFWGTWCGWCIKGMPEMKKYYAKYKSKIEFVGIDCRDTEEKWRKGVKENQLPWTNLFNGTSDELTNNYAISGYPTKILIDKEGKIVDVFVGESPALYKKLDELFK